MKKVSINERRLWIIRALMRLGEVIASEALTSHFRHFTGLDFKMFEDASNSLRVYQCKFSLVFGRGVDRACMEGVLSISDIRASQDDRVGSGKVYHSGENPRTKATCFQVIQTSANDLKIVLDQK